MVDSVCTMLLVNTLKQIGGVVLGSHLLLVDDVDASLVEGYGVCRGEDAIVLQLHRFGMIHTVTVYRHVVHHTDVDNALLLVEVVHHGLSCCCHTFEEAILITDELRCPQLAHIQLFHLASRVDVSLAVLTGAADGEVLQRTTVATHRSD